VTDAGSPIGALAPIPAARARTGDQVYETLREAISSGRIPPGSRLPEEEIAAQLAVSRTQVREALRRLEGEGLAAPARGRGLVVTEIGPEYVDDIGRIRVALDRVAAELAAERATAEGWRQVMGLVDQLDTAVAGGVPEGIRQAHRNVHRAIYRLAFNGRIATFLENNVLQFLEISTQLNQPDADVDRTTVAEHRRLIEALGKGDRDAAITAADAHAVSGARAAARRRSAPSP
jgi:DNA-binding GntR family transcriptional regulator